MPSQLDVTIDRSSPVPLYHQLAQAIERSILAGELTPGDRIENEVELSRRLNVSRPTTRQAIQALVDKGLLVRKRGVGTQVVRNQIQRPVELTSLFDDLVAAGQRPTTKLLDYRLEVPGPDVADEFGLDDGTQVVTIKRLRGANDEPLAIMTNHVPADLAPAPDDLEERGFYECLRAKGVHIQLARQRIGADVCDSADAALLEEKPGSALLTMQRVAFDDDGRVVEVGRHRYRATRYFFEVTVVDG